MADERTVADLLAENPALASALESVLAVDAEQDRWAFDDVPVDSGQFGKLVELGIVESAGSEYRLADQAAVRDALEAHDGETAEAGNPEGDEASDAAGVGSISPSSWSRPELNADAIRNRSLSAAGVVVGIVALFVATRAFIYRGVFRDGDVVLTVNDPYYYRYGVEQLLELSNGPLDVSVLWRMPRTFSVGEPLYVAVMWALSTLAGGTPHAAGVVLAWYPVVAAALTGLLVYRLGSRVLGDRRVGLAAAAILAVSPGYATRTGLGYADHHPFDYLWLTATVLVLARVVTTETAGDGLLGEHDWKGAAVLGLLVAGQTLAWQASPILLVPIGIYVAVAVPLDVDAGRSPLHSTAPVVSLGLATLLVGVVTLALGWLSPAVPAALAALFCASGAVVALGELAHRRDWSATRVGTLEVGAAILAFVAVAVLVPDLGSQVASKLGVLFGTGGVGEAGSLFAPDRLFGLEFFGFFLLLALPFMLWGAWRSLLGNATWLVLSAYAWYFLVLSAVQVRFMGPLAPVLSVFGALGFVWLLSYLGVWKPPAPLGDGQQSDGDGQQSDGDEPDTHDRDEGPAPSAHSENHDDAAGLLSKSGLRTGAIVLVCFLLVGSLSLANLGHNVTVTVHDERIHETATWMGEYADERGWTTRQSYVFSRWEVNRVYNYFANGYSQTYAYAQNNYREFIYAKDPGAWYERLDNRVGFVVIEALPRRPGTIQTHLYRAYGSRYDGTEGVSHYRAVYATAKQYKKVFTLVPGAEITGTAAANATVRLRTEVRIPNATFTYRRVTSTGADGTYSVTVPYPGEYTVTVGNETRTVTVPEQAVTNGNRVRARG